MKKRWRLGTIFGVEVWLTFGSILLSGVLWLIFAAVGLLWLEPTLHANIHIQRALGGPAVSLFVTLLSGLLLLSMPDSNELLYILIAFIFWENLLVFFLGALLPLGFTDGSTLLHWWPRRHEPLP